MGLLLMITLLFITAPLEVSASNKTSCDANPNRATCTQAWCRTSPCSMLCGLHTRYDICNQKCVSRECYAVECRPTERCHQLCWESNCESIICGAKDCQQQCTLGRCNMSCLSSVATQRCQQKCIESTCESMVCNATNCTQSGSHRQLNYNMTCPLGEKNCNQTAVEGTTNMRCEGDVCKQQCESGNCTMTCSRNVTKCEQFCYGENCNMTCTSTVKECHQFCLSGNCLIKCEAENCILFCLGGTCNAAKPLPFSKGATLKISSVGFMGLMFALAVNILVKI